MHRFQAPAGRLRRTDSGRTLCSNESLAPILDEEGGDAVWQTAF